MQTSPQVQAVPLSQCRHGHDYPLLPINPRKTGDDPEMDEFRAGLRESGQLQPGRAILSKTGETAYVYIGGRRLTALTLNAADDPSAPATIDLYVDAITPRQALLDSLAEQDRQKPLHPADQAKSYADLVAQGFDVADIAKRFGVKKRYVVQLVALGEKITPKVWEAWRADEIDQRCAEAFTLAPNAETMDKVFDAMKRGHQLHPQFIRAALQGDQGDAARFVNFIGVDTYIAAGGSIVVDLFEDEHTIGDKPLAMALAKKKIDDECARLVDEGWSWAAPLETLPASWKAWQVSTPKVVQYTDEETARLEAIETELQPLVAKDNTEWLHGEEKDRFEALQTEAARIQDVGELRSFSDRQKKKCGCALSISAEGRLVIHPGLIRPVEPAVPEGRVLPDQGAEAESAAPPPEAPVEKVPVISAGLAQDLALQLNTASARTIAENPDIAMAIALAAFQINCDDGAVRLLHSGHGSGALKLTDSYDFAANVKAFLAMTADQRAAMFAHVVAASLKFTAPNAAHHAMMDEQVRAVVSVLPADALRKELLACFDRQSYFERAPKAFALAAIEDVKGHEKADAMSGDAKGELVTVAIDWSAEAEWLPLELRPPNAFWDGRQHKTDKPAKVAPKKPAPKKPAKKQPAKKPVKKQRGKK